MFNLVTLSVSRQNRKKCVLSSTPWSYGPICHVLDWEVKGLNLVVNLLTSVQTEDEDLSTSQKYVGYA